MKQPEENQLDYYNIDYYNIRRDELGELMRLVNLYCPGSVTAAAIEKEILNRKVQPDNAEYYLIKKTEVDFLGIAAFSHREKCSKMLAEVRKRGVSLDKDHLTVGMVAAYESGLDAGRMEERDRILSALNEWDEPGVIAMLKDIGIE